MAIGRGGFAPAILAENRPECLSPVQRNESEKNVAAYAYQPGPTVVRVSPGGVLRAYRRLARHNSAKI